MISVSNSRVLAVALSAIVLAGCATGPSAWQVAQKENTADAYRIFLQENPNHRYASRGRAGLERAAGREASRSESQAEIEAFLAEFPRSQYKDRALRRLATLKQQAASARKKVAWEQVKQRDTVDAYRDYFEAHPRDRRLKERNARFEELGWAEAKSKGAVESYTVYLNDHPKGIRREVAHLRIKTLKNAALRRQAKSIAAKISNPESRLVRLVNSANDSLSSHYRYHRCRSITAMGSGSFDEQICSDERHRSAKPLMKVKQRLVMPELSSSPCCQGKKIWKITLLCLPTLRCSRSTVTLPFLEKLNALVAHELLTRITQQHPPICPSTPRTQSAIAAIEKKSAKERARLSNVSKVARAHALKKSGLRLGIRPAPGDAHIFGRDYMKLRVTKEGYSALARLRRDESKRKVELAFLASCLPRSDER